MLGRTPGNIVAIRPMRDGGASAVPDEYTDGIGPRSWITGAGISSSSGSVMCIGVCGEAYLPDEPSGRERTPTIS